VAVYKNDAHLQGLWLLEETSGTRYDSSPNDSNDLTDNNTVGYSTDSQEGSNSADFENGQSEYLSIADASQTGLDITGDLSIVAWIKPESFPVTIHTIVAKYTADTGKRGYLFYTRDWGSGEKLSATLSDDGTTQNIAKGATTLSAGTWYHVAVVYDGTDIRLYVDGSLDSNGADNPKTYSGGIYDTGEDFVLGSESDASTNWHWDGLMDEVAVFDRALSASEVSDIYDNGIQDPPAGGGAWPILSGDGVHSPVFGGLVVR
jgi:hypothetical protein